MNCKEFITGLFGVAGITSIAKCFATSTNIAQADEIHKYAVKAAKAYMQTYATYPVCSYSSVAPVGMFYYKQDGQYFTTVIELPDNVRRSYCYSKQDIQDKLEHWFVDKCYETVNKYKGHAITFDVDPWLTRKAQV